MDENKHQGSLRSPDEQSGPGIGVTTLPEQHQRDTQRDDTRQRRDYGATETHKRWHPTATVSAAIVQALSAFLILIVTAFYTYYASLQVQPLKNSADAALRAAMAAEDAAKAAKDNAAAATAQTSIAGRQADAALRAVELSQRANALTERATRQNLESARLDERAWLSVSYGIEEEPTSEGNVVVNNVPDPSHQFAGHIVATLVNSGKTPALHVRTKGVLPRFASQSSPAPNWNEQPPFPALVKQVSVIYSGESAKQNVVLPFLTIPATVTKYRAHEQHIWLWLRVDYCDVFGRAHWIQSCVFHPSPDWLNLPQFAMCPTGNETDDGQPERDCVR